MFGVPSNAKVQVCDPKVGRPSVFSSCTLSAAAALAAVNGGKPIDPATLVPGQILTTPTVALPTTIALKEGVTSIAAVKLLSNAMSRRNGGIGSAIAITPSAELKLIQPLQTDDPIISGTSCGENAGSSTTWPLNVEDIRVKLLDAQKIASDRGVSQGPSVIRVADTGFLGLTSFFPLDAIDQNTHETASQPYDLDGNRYIADRFGIDSENTGDIAPYEDSRYRDHGTQVADLVLGGSELRTNYPKIYDLTKVAFVKIFWKGSGAITVKDETFLQAMRHIENHSDPRVVNFSVGAGDENNTRLFEETMRLASQLNYLVVIAAGNDDNDISSIPMYPASYGGTGSDISSWIMTVGASSPDGKKAPFSNYSSTRVDLLAPGCRIPFTMDPEKIQYLNGTSLAAPIVSFIAAALRSLGITNMRQVKIRIIASADFNHELANKTRYGGIVLNAERALSLFYDVIQWKGSVADVLGTWSRPDGEIKLCQDGDVLNPNRILALSSYEAQGVQRFRILRTEVDGRMADPMDCVAAEGVVDFSSNDGVAHSIKLSDVTLLVPAYPYPKQ
jgi:subtilisin family serine protease